MTNRSIVAGAAALALSISRPLLAQDIDTKALGDETVSLLQEYIRINTVNPPGNESEAVAFFARLLDREGIPYETAESGPGRGNIWARLEGGDQPALVLLHHTDVVPADREHWTTDPLSGEIRDGFLYGRGALDTKSLGMQHFMTFVALHRAGVPLNRDVIFMATADEEAGGSYGAGWLAEQRPELFQNVGLLLNEGGGGRRDGNGVVFEIEVTQKVPHWFELTAVGEPGHGSTPHVTSAVTRLIRALDRLATYEFEPRIIPAVDAYFQGIAPNAGIYWRPRFADIAATVRNPDDLTRLQIETPFYAAITRNTCAITMLEGSTKINVVPPAATAQIDCRLLPDQDPEAFLAELTSVINDPAITIRRIMGFTPAVSSTDTDLYRAIVHTLERHYPDAPVIPSIQSGFTDSHFFRGLGIVCYGFSGAVIPAEDQERVHGNDERIPLEEVRRGLEIMLDVVRAVAGG